MRSCVPRGRQLSAAADLPGKFKDLSSSHSRPSMQISLDLPRRAKLGRKLNIFSTLRGFWVARPYVAVRAANRNELTQRRGNFSRQTWPSKLRLEGSAWLDASRRSPTSCVWISSRDSRAGALAEAGPADWRQCGVTDHINCLLTRLMDSDRMAGGLRRPRRLVTIQEGSSTGCPAADGNAAYWQTNSRATVKRSPYCKQGAVESAK